VTQIRAKLDDAEAESEAESEEHREQYRAAYQAALSALLNSPKYRGESIGKRRHLVSSILAEAGVEEMPEVFMTRQVQPEANRIIGEKVYEYEQDFRARKSELADELRTYPAWQRVYTQIKRKAATAEFLKEKADGYRLSTDLAGEISEAAANPVYVSRY
jgi:stress-induced morphogen